jgi:hypothetical protein
MCLDHTQLHTHPVGPSEQVIRASHRQTHNTHKWREHPNTQHTQVTRTQANTQHTQVTRTPKHTTYTSDENTQTHNIHKWREHLNTQHTQVTRTPKYTTYTSDENTHALNGIRTRDLSNPATSDLRQRSRWDRQFVCLFVCFMDVQSVTKFDSLFLSCLFFYTMLILFLFYYPFNVERLIKTSRSEPFKN